MNRLDLFAAIQIGREFATEGRTRGELNGYMNRCSFDELTRLRVERTYNEELHRGNGHTVFRGRQARNGGMEV